MGEEEGPTVSMLEVLQDEEALEEDAAAVLGATSDSECSYSKGYVARQPLYACPSKVSPETPAGGVCLACCLNCHEGQQLVELYTKRNFRCDCGTPRLGNKCTLDQVGKEKENQLNKYNQNFRGLYCICSRPYPDPESTVDDCMIQCVVCEDWFHGRHLGREGGPPGDSEYAEMICEGCVKLYPFLMHYARLDVTLADNESKPVDVVSVEDSDNGIEVKNNIKETANLSEKIDDLKDESENVENICKLTSPLPSTVPTSLFLPGGWRSKLCLCPSCDQLYKDKGLAYLCDETDTVHHYEGQASNRPGVLEKGMEALGQMDRVKQVEAIQSYNNMKENLMEYLAKFANSNKVVREEDIKTFFEEMKSNKRRRIEGAPPSNCK